MSEAPVLFILDDEPEDVEWVVDTARDFGYQVYQATRVDEAIKTCSRLGPINVAIVDLRIGPDDERWDEGWRFLQEAKFAAGTQIVILTGHRSPGELARKPPGDMDVRFEFCRKGFGGDDRVREVLRAQLEKHQMSMQDGVVIESAADKQLYANIPMIAKSGLPVLITGPSGCGKENVAQQIARAALPEEEHDRIETLNCAALTENVAISTLFGYVRGAFTDAAPQGREGILERIGGDPSGTDYNKKLPGILILDELAELPVFVQAQLLRMLQGQRIHRLGDTGIGYIPVIRVVACTNDEEKLADPKRFRQDLLARLDGWHITIGHPHERKATFLRAAKEEATAFSMTLEFGKAPAKISSVSRDFPSAIEDKLIPPSEGGLKFGFRELKAWVGRACALALYRAGNDTQVTAAHLAEAWEKRMRLAEDTAPAERVDLAMQLVEESSVSDSKARDLRSRFEKLITAERIELDEGWDEADLKDAATKLRAKSMASFKKLVTLKKQYSKSNAEAKALLYRAIKGTNGTKRQIELFIGRLRRWLGESD